MIEFKLDRRSFIREPLDRPCKLFHYATRRFMVGRTQDLSEGGALISVPAEVVVERGDNVDLAIAWGGKPILPTDVLISARVVRVETDEDDQQVVAVEFGDQAELAAVA